MAASPTVQDQSDLTVSQPGLRTAGPVCVEYCCREYSAASVVVAREVQVQVYARSLFGFAWINIDHHVFLRVKFLSISTSRYLTVAFGCSSIPSSVIKAPLGSIYLLLPVTIKVVFICTSVGVEPLHRGLSILLQSVSCIWSPVAQGGIVCVHVHWR